MADLNENKISSTILPDPNIKNIKSLEISPEKRKSQNRLSKFEKARILSIRSEQLKNGATPLIDPKKYGLQYDINYYYTIATYELKEKVIPFKIKRTYQDGSYEIWNIKELAVISESMN